MRHATAMLCVLLVVAAAVPATAGAASDNDSESLLNDVLDTEDGSRLDTALGFAAGLADRASNFVAGVSDEKSPDEHAGDFKSTFNTHNQTIQSYVNARTNASTSADVLELTFDEDDEDAATVYLVADVNGSDYENATVVDSTSRSVDETCTLEDAAARNADDEVAHFVDEFADPGVETTAAYKSQLASEYGGKIDCSFL